MQYNQKCCALKIWNESNHIKLSFNRDKQILLPLCVNSPNHYTTGTSIGLSKGLTTNLQQRGNNQFANDVWQSR